MVYGLGLGLRLWSRLRYKPVPSVRFSAHRNGINSPIPAEFESYTE